MQLLKNKFGPVGITKKSIFNTLRKTRAEAVGKQNRKPFAYIKNKQQNPCGYYKNTVAEISYIFEKIIERVFYKAVKVLMKGNFIRKRDSKTGCAKNERVGQQEKFIF